MLIIRRAYRSTKPPEKIRMNPARTTRSGACASIAVASARSNASRSGYARWSIAVVATPRPDAIARPCASGRLLMTATTSAAILPSRTASSIAVMLEPRPEMRMTSRFMIVDALCGPLDDDRARRARCSPLDSADQIRRLTERRETIDRRLRGASIDDQHHADAAVEYANHFGARDVARALQPVEYRRAGPERGIDARGEPGPEHAVRILGQAAARDVRHSLDFNLRQQREDRLDIDACRLEQCCAECRADDAVGRAVEIRA